MKAINREILSIAVPSIITNITTPLLALMDVVIVGHMGNANYIAAIAVGGTIFNMLYWLFAFLRMGSSGLTAQAHGADDRQEVSFVLMRGLTVAVVASLLMLIFQSVILQLSLNAMEVEAEVREMVSEYFRILIWGAPASLATFVMTGWFLGMKDAKTPMWIAFIINISNIAVSLTLVLGAGMKISGVACGTLSAQWIGCVVGMFVVIFKYHPHPASLSAILQPDKIKRFFSVNIDIFFRTLCLIMVTVWFTRVGATQGTVILAVNTLLMQFFILFSYFMDGFAFAGESICGNYIGQKDRVRLKAALKSLFQWSIVMVIIFTAVYAFAGEEIMGLLSDDKEVIASSKEYFNWVIAIPIVGFAAFTWDGIFIGATRTREMLISISVATAVYFALYFLLFPILGNHGLWIAFLCYLLSRGVVLTLFRHRLDRI